MNFSDFRFNSASIIGILIDWRSLRIRSYLCCSGVSSIKHHYDDKSPVDGGDLEKKFSRPSGRF